jgi:hypothetical protein
MPVMAEPRDRFFGSFQLEPVTNKKVGNSYNDDAADQ